jgi:hypothetical protein
MLVEFMWGFDMVKSQSNINILFARRLFLKKMAFMKSVKVSTKCPLTQYVLR